ncbi:oxygen-dependent tRNA uridine(34) hydroxylase TrhO [Xylophilus sp. ASV27]|uniref:oxygen-dependent tRNA uridine(34) hydroxylase TrhO n=1 Tax=Xylophilus sp. ASV27 TaxID=2795129 RepID=UPI0018EE100E|nr:rhodanese-related sulfurtransferase [Xylophilus sp. ASV27]
MADFLTAALYKFVALPDHAALQPPLLACCEAHAVKGTLLLAAEGINGTIAGPPAGVHAVLAWLRGDPRLTDLQHKEAAARFMPFYRLRVRLKREIVTLGIPGLDPAEHAGTYVKPQDWNALIGQPGVVLVDVRNDYEVAIGSFEGAIDPRTRSFSELPAWVARESQPGGVLAGDGNTRPRVAMFCTGGIRCEKSTAYLRSQGFDEVYHLEGGILKYLETVPEEQSRWRGDCFVFDERVSVGHGLAPGHHELCRSCRWPLGAAERASPLFQRGISCPYCHGTRSEEELRALAERHKQVELAQRRSRMHIGARMPGSASAGAGQQKLSVAQSAQPLR